MGKRGIFNGSIEVYNLIIREDIGHVTSYLLCFPTKWTWGVESNPENGWQLITYHQKMRNLSKKTNPSNTKHHPRNHGLVGDVRIYRTRGSQSHFPITLGSVPKMSFAEVAWEPQEICLVTYIFLNFQSYSTWNDYDPKMTHIFHGGRSTNQKSLKFSPTPRCEPSPKEILPEFGQKAGQVLGSAAIHV